MPLSTFRTIYRLAFATLVIAVFVACMVLVPEGLVFSWQDKARCFFSLQPAWLSQLALRSLDVLWWFDRNRAVQHQLCSGDVGRRIRRVWRSVSAWCC